MRGRDVGGFFRPNRRRAQGCLQQNQHSDSYRHADKYVNPGVYAYKYTYKYAYAAPSYQRHSNVR